jgi:hypothetical protein
MRISMDIHEDMRILCGISRDALWRALMAEARDVATYCEVTPIKLNLKIGKIVVKLLWRR